MSGPSEARGDTPEARSARNGEARDARKEMSGLVLAAPLAGWATRLDEVPDAAFARGMVGDGVAIDPISSELCAPCDSVVMSVHRARHACTLRTEGGAEILLHIGVDTVELHGEGLRALVTDGQRVTTGQ